MCMLVKVLKPQYDDWCPVVVQCCHVMLRGSNDWQQHRSISSLTTSYKPLAFLSSTFQILHGCLPLGVPMLTINMNSSVAIIGTTQYANCKVVLQTSLLQRAPHNTDVLVELVIISVKAPSAVIGLQAELQGCATVLLL